MAFRTVKSEHIPRSVDFWFIIHEANLYTELVRHRVVLYISNTGMRYVMVAYNYWKWYKEMCLIIKETPLVAIVLFLTTNCYDASTVRYSVACRSKIIWWDYITNHDHFQLQLFATMFGIYEPYNLSQKKSSTNDQKLLNIFFFWNLCDKLNCTSLRSNRMLERKIHLWLYSPYIVALLCYFHHWHPGDVWPK